MTNVWKHVACLGCGCVCDDVTVAYEGDRLVRFEPACGLGEQWFKSHENPPQSAAELSGETAGLDEAIEHAALLLRDAEYPLVYGLSRSATPGQRAAVALGESLGAVVDTTASLCHGPSIMAIQEVGEVTCTLGEIRNRADLVILWGCNPAESHPRHAERYSVTASGQHVPGGRSDRKVVMIGDAEQVHDWKIDDRGTTADLTIAVEPGKDFEVLSRLLCLVNGEPSLHSAKPGIDAETEDKLHQLMTMIRQCQYGVVFFGLGLAGESSWAESRQSQIGHVNVAALLKLVAELNAVTRFTARRMRLQGDVSGADNVLCWQTGYPFAVDFSRGYPRYNPGEFSANDALERGDVDLCVLVGGETVPYLSERARERLMSIPVIVLDYPNVPLSFTPQVRFTTAVYGLHAAGTVYRMDNVPIPLRKLVSSQLPTDEQILDRLRSRYQQFAEAEPFAPQSVEQR